MNTVLFDSTQFTPSKIVCIGKNYAEHIQELNSEVPTEPVIFIKPNSSISNELFYNETDELHFEGEISFLVMDQRLAGVGFGLDLTKRRLQSYLKNKGLPWERSKAFDRSAVYSRFVPIPNGLATLSMELSINQHRVQSGNYDLMIYKPERILEEISSIFTLEDGDIIMTGTPKGVGPFARGDLFHGKVFSGETLIIEQKWTAK